MREQKLTLRDEVNVLKDWAIDCLRRPGVECAEKGVVGRRETVVRVIELSPNRPRPVFHLSSVKVAEYQVQGFDQ